VTENENELSCVMAYGVSHRVCLAGIQQDGYVIHNGTNRILPIYGVHNHPVSMQLTRSYYALFVYAALYVSAQD
jgi:hypothetical protein